MTGLLAERSRSVISRVGDINGGGLGAGVFLGGVLLGKDIKPMMRRTQ